MDAPLLLGVDGGGSRTRALLATPAGDILGAADAGPSNYQSAGFDAAAAALQAAVGNALARAGLAPSTPLAAACLGLAGAGRPNDRARFERWAAEMLGAGRVLVVSDVELVLAAGTPRGWGLALISGTGSCCWGRAADGRTARAGGWGHLLGDEGSGYDLAVKALRLATRTADGRAAASALLDAILAHWRLAAPEQLIGHVYSPHMTRAEIAGLAAPVVALAEQGDPFALDLLEQAADELAEQVAATARALDLHAPPLALAGGLLGASPRLRALVALRAGAAPQDVRLVEDPAHGALLLARSLLEGQANQVLD